MIRVIGAWMGSTLVCTAYVLSALGYGLVPLTAWDSREDDYTSAPLRFALALLVGLGILNGIWTVIGALNLFTTPIVLIGVLIGFALAVFLLLRKYSESVRSLPRSLNETASWPLGWKALLLLVAFQVILYAVLALATPPLGDAEAFYMVIPKVVVEAQGLAILPNYWSFTQIGFSGELHFASLMAIADAKAAKLLVWFVAIAIVVLVLAFCRRLEQSYRGKIVAVIMLLTSTTYTYYIFDGKVDLFSAAFGLAFLFLFLYRFHEPREQLLSGFLLGIAAVGKLSYIPVMIAVVSSVVAWRFLASVKTKTVKKEVSRVGLLMAGAFVGFLPHLIKNYHLYAAPLAPLLKIGDQEGSSLFNQVWFSSGPTRHILLTYPIALTLGRYPMQGGVLSPLLLAFLPCSLLAAVGYLPTSSPKVRRDLKKILLLWFVTVGTWLLVRPSVLAPRYILGPLLLVIPALSTFVDKILVAQGRRLLKTAVVGAMILCTVTTLVDRSISSLIRSLSGPYNKDGVVIMGPHRSALEYLNTRARHGARVYLAGYYAYHLRSDLLLQISSQEEQAEARSIATASERLKYLIRHGYDFVVIQNRSAAGGVWDGVASLSQSVYSDEHSIVLDLTTGARKE
jgi:hypothetical protein